MEPEAPALELADVHPSDTIASPEANTGAMDDVPESHDIVVQSDEDCDTPIPDLPLSDMESIDNDAIIKTLEKRAKRVLNWETFLALLITSGYGNFTADQFETLNDVISSAGHGSSIPTYKTTNSSIWRMLRDESFPRSVTLFVGHTSRPRSRLNQASFVKVFSGDMKDPRDCARVVFPSEWAKVDLRSRTFFNEVYSSNSRNEPDHYSIEDAPIVCNREVALMQKLRVWISRRGCISTADTGETITFTCQKEPRTPTNQPWLQTFWKATHAVRSNSRNVLMKGTLGAVWVVSNRTTERSVWVEPSGLDPTEKCIWTSLRVSNVSISHQTGAIHPEPQGDDFDDDDWDYNVRNLERQARGNTSQQLMTFYVPSGSTVDVLPGDVCVIVRPVGTVSDPDHFCVYHASMLGVCQGGVSERLVWIKKPTNAECAGYINELGKRIKPPIAAHTTVISMPSTDVESEGIRGPGYSTALSGDLENGEKFYVYRLCLYADGFKQLKSLADTRSVTGCYMLPMGVSLKSRSSSSSVRAITLSPSGHDENTVLNAIIEDLVKGSIEGIPGKDPSGRSIRISLDPVTFLGDYPAVAAVTDCLGHTANAFCTLCSISKRQKSKSARIVYNSSIHSRRMAYCRFKERLDVMRSGSIPVKVLRKVGLTGLSSTSVSSLPLVRLEQELGQGRSAIPVTAAGKRVVPGIFDACLSTAAAPDHLVTGLIKNGLTFCFKILDNDRLRKEVEILILHTMKSNGLPTETHILRWDSYGKCKGLHSLTMLSLFCILSISGHVFRRYSSSFPGDPFSILRDLQKLVSIMFWTPTSITDGPDNVSFVGKGSGKDYLKLSCTRAKSYVDKLKHLHANNGNVGSILDKPNAHRLLELCVHTIPLFGHARHVTELVMENTHKEFKGWLEKNSHPDSHLSGVDRLLRRDWLSRVSSSRSYPNERSEGQVNLQNRELLRLFLGQEVDMLNLEDRRSTETLERFENMLEPLFRPPIEKFLSMASPAISTGRVSIWEGKDKEKNPKWPSRVRNALSLLTSALLEIKAGDDTDENPRFIHHERAGYVRNRCGSRKGISYGHDLVRQGDFLQAMVSTPLSRVLVPPDDGLHCSRYFFIVIAILGVADSPDVYAAVNRLQPCDDQDGFENVHDLGEEDMQFLYMGENVRRAGMIHMCGNDEGCRVNSARGTVSHGLDIMCCGSCVILGREQGFPPHMG